MECSGPREQHTPRGDVAVAPRPPVHDGSSGDAGGLLGLLPANTVHETTENQRFLLQAGRAQEAADFLGGLQKVPNDSGFDDDSSPTIAALAVHMVLDTDLRVCDAESGDYLLQP